VSSTSFTTYLISIDGQRSAIASRLSWKHSRKEVGFRHYPRIYGGFKFLVVTSSMGYSIQLNFMKESHLTPLLIREKRVNPGLSSRTQRQLAFVSRRQSICARHLPRPCIAHLLTSHKSSRKHPSFARDTKYITIRWPSNMPVLVIP
jgi:hypothetical protein